MNKQRLTVTVLAYLFFPLFYGTLFFYIGFMSLKEKEHQKKLKEKFGAIWYGFYVLLFIGLIMDTLFNWTVGTLYYREFPQEFLFTTRCNRHLTTGKGKQLSRAHFVCDNMLDPFDKGHCE
jgi:hypothetical protein